MKENAVQMKYLITLENNIDKFFIEEEEIKGVYAEIDDSEGYGGISKAFKEIDNFLIATNQTLVPVGMFAFTIKKDEIEKKTYNYNRLILLKNYEDYEKRCHYPKQKYACMICQSKFDDIGQSVEKVVEWMKKEGREIGEDTIVHILSGPAFEKDPSDVMYILRVPIKR